jgi:hypothetical protein
MNANLRAGWGAKYLVLCAALPPIENVYSRAADCHEAIILYGRLRVRFPRLVRLAEANPPFGSIALHWHETKRCNDIAK